MDLDKYGDDRLCGSCHGVLQAGQTLFNEKVSDLDVIVPTIAFAAEYGADCPDERAEEVSEKHAHLEPIGIVYGVMLLREKAAAVRVVPHHDAPDALADHVQIKVFFKHAKPEDVAVLYEQALREWNIPWHKSSGGSFVWYFDDKHLTIEVGLGRELDPDWITLLSESAGRPPRGMLPSFPPPAAVSGMYETLRGSYYEDSLSGFSHALGGSPWPMSAEKAIPASAAWWLSRNDETTPKGGKPAHVRRRVAGVLSRHLLEPCDRGSLSDQKAADTTLWRDSQRLEIRLYGALDSLLNPSS